jgi:threonine synthase
MSVESEFIYIMEYISYIKNLSCASCGNLFGVDQIQTYCLDCKAPLLANCNLQLIKNNVDREQIGHRHKGIWRWFELLPVPHADNIISLGEGDTPLLRLSGLGRILGLTSLFLKDEALNPTGSFKARGMSIAISKAKELGIKRVVIPSAGNAGGALVAYAA